MIASINLNSDSTVTKDLKNIARYHSDDPQMQNLKDEFKAAQPPTGDRNNLLNYVLCCKNEKRHPYFSPFLHASLEGQVSQFVHKALGHRSNGKCNVQ